MPEQKEQLGAVSLVGAGPGDPGLISMRGINALQAADVVLYDYLVNPVLTVHAQPGAELICLGKHGNSRIWTQQQINERMVTEALRGKQVVRLKSGDPSIFGRLAEEVAVLEANQIPYVIIPGISAAMAAGAYAGVPVTHRDHASAVAFITGREASDKSGPDLDFAALAKFPGTIVIYMGVTTAERWTNGLIQGGMDACMPVALVRKCSRPDQRVIRCQLNEVPSRLTPYSKFPPPVIAIIGHVSTAGLMREWFSELPLFGKTVLVTRPQDQCATLREALSSLGAHVLEQPAISIDPPPSWDEVDTSICELKQCDWIIFSSANGVRFYCDRVKQLGFDARQFGSVKIATIGPRTAAALHDYGLRSDLTPETFQAETLAATLTAANNNKSSILLVRASRGRDVLKKQLQSVGHDVKEIVAYRSTDASTASVDADVMQQLEAGQVDWVTVTSSAIARSLDSLFKSQLSNCKLASISPVTTETLTGLGYEVAAEATTYTIQGLIAAMVAAETSR